jgi:hypothetical protein
MYRGVYHRPDKKTKQWAARIKIDGKEKYLGYFLTSKEAACVYDEAAKLEFGEFASLNFPSGV